MNQLNQIINFTVQEVAGERLHFTQEQFSESMQHYMQDEAKAEKL